MGNCYSFASRTPSKYPHPPSPVVTFLQPENANANLHVVELATQQVNRSGKDSAFTSVTPGTDNPRPTLTIPPEQPI